MDDQQGHFTKLSKEDAQKNLDNDMTKGRVFQVGEVLCIKDSTFRVKSIKPSELRLKLLPRNS